METKPTPFQIKEENKRSQRYVNTASKGSARYEKRLDEFTEMESIDKQVIHNPFEEDYHGPQ